MLQCWAKQTPCRTLSTAGDRQLKDWSKGFLKGRHHDFLFSFPPPSKGLEPALDRQRPYLPRPGAQGSSLSIS